MQRILPLKKTAFTICLFFAVCKVFSQDSLITENSDFSLTLRGKIVGFFIIEDIYFATYTLGAELIHNERHSLGVDYTFFRWRNETDDIDDNSMYSQYETRTYLLVDYKYTYWHFYSADLYLNMYGKVGNYKMWYKPYDYPFGNQDATFLQSTAKGTFNEPGIGLGIRKYFVDSGFGIDCSANAAYHISNNDERIYISQTETQFRDNVSEEKMKFYVRLNLFYNFGK